MQAKKSTGKEVLQRAEKTYELFEELRAELTALYGSCLQLPNRKELLSSGRCDSLLPQLPLSAAHACIGV